MILQEYGFNESGYAVSATMGELIQELPEGTMKTVLVAKLTQVSSERKGEIISDGEVFNYINKLNGGLLPGQTSNDLGMSEQLLAIIDVMSGKLRKLKL